MKVTKDPFTQRITVPLSELSQRISAADTIKLVHDPAPCYYLSATESAGGNSTIQFRICRTGPARDIHYSECIQGYDELDEDEQMCAETAVDELFYLEEATALQHHLRERYDMILHIRKLDLPLPSTAIGVMCRPIGGAYGQAVFETEDERMLGFSYIACYQRRRSKHGKRASPARLIFLSKRVQSLLEELGERYMESRNKARDCVR